jgi:hypothetical protein
MEPIQDDFIKMVDYEPVTNKFSEQNEFILKSVKIKNQFKARQIIATYDLENTIFDVFKKFQHNYIEMRKVLENYFEIREKTLLQLTSKL